MRIKFCNHLSFDDKEVILQITIYQTVMSIEWSKKQKQNKIKPYEYFETTYRCCMITREAFLLFADE